MKLTESMNIFILFIGLPVQLNWILKKLSWETNALFQMYIWWMACSQRIKDLLLDKFSIYWEQNLSNIKMRFFFGKNIERKHLYRHDKNYYYFCKSDIPVINLIVGSRNMIKLSKNISLKKNRQIARVVFTKYQQFFSVFHCFWMGQDFGKCNG